ncbi:iron-containing alcohol dehydrogenase [Lampropedia puyangensis]|uniref:Iron-containing alcohol dehydrogenase n=1 Tax=Lampropedia puyangensis TaxID=1330072 RepID=A0A4V6T2T0_9BURK|nr:iron-containing alcohol dehydrogenase [Lampropedia puyangensis]THU03976.1 iron-containing alcohol dehydrogenase [Lampropedia puyangensis]
MAFINYVTQIQFDFGAIAQLATECDRIGIARPLIVTDAGVVAAGIVRQVQQQLKDMPVTVFDQTPSNPTEAAVRAATAMYRTHHCDGLIAVGGGSSIDCAKGVAIAVSHEGPLKTYATIEGGSAKITANVAPIIAVPTTSGTGSEVARGAILIVDDGRKLGFHSWHLVPKSAICDPDLTLGLPAGLTAATGMDAIAHCMETFMAAAFNPPADGIALDGLTRGWSHIAEATHHGDNRQARLNLMAASMQGAMAFQKGLGCVHSLSHSLGGINPQLHHGTLNAVFLPAVLRFNAQAPNIRDEQRMQRMAHAMGVTLAPASTAETAAAQLANAVQMRNHELGMPKGLAQMGIVETDFALIIERALRDHCHATNPIIASPADYHRMLEESM